VRLKHDGPIHAIVFSPDGRWVATGSLDNTARVWDAASGQEHARLQHQELLVQVICAIG